MRKIGVGTLVSVEQESTGRGRGRPSEGGIGFVVKCKKQQRMEDKNGETPVVELTQQSTTSTTTAGTGATMFDIRYSLDGRLSQEVNKNRVRVGMLGTTARQRNGSREVRPSLLTACTTTTTNNNNNNMPKWHLHWLLAMEEMILYESVADCTTTSAIAVQQFVERMESQWGLKSSHATTTVRKRKTTTKTTIKNFTTKNLMWRRS